jgi:hypothetical protein
MEENSYARNFLRLLRVGCMQNGWNAQSYLSGTAKIRLERFYQCTAFARSIQEGAVMDKRDQVFVSSTFQDLQDERQEVMQAILELDCIPAGMELFPAANEEQWTLIKKVINDCDYYIVITAGRYGSIGP